MSGVPESIVENAIWRRLDPHHRIRCRRRRARLLDSLGWNIAHGPDIAPDTPNAERNDYGQVVLERRLRDALAQLNEGLPAEALDDAFRKLNGRKGRRWKLVTGRSTGCWWRV